MSTPQLIALEPPYAYARRMHGAAPALGAVLLLDAVEAPLSAEVLRTTMAAAPWCPLVVLARTRANVRQVRRSARVTVLYEKREGAPANVDDVLGAVAERSRPTASDIVEWVAERTGLRMIARTMCDLLGRPALTPAAEAGLPFAVRDRLASLGRWGGAEWQQAARIAEAAGDEGAVERFLTAYDSDTALARRRMTELLGICELDLRERAGWEWVLETALWRAGFFAAREAAALAAAARASESRTEYAGAGRPARAAERLSA